MPPGQVPRHWHQNGGTRTAAPAGQCSTSNSRNGHTARGDRSICREGEGRRRQVTPGSINITFFFQPPRQGRVAAEAGERRAWWGTRWAGVASTEGGGAGAPCATSPRREPFARRGRRPPQERTHAAPGPVQSEQAREPPRRPLAAAAAAAWPVAATPTGHVTEHNVEGRRGGPFPSGMWPPRSSSADVPGVARKRLHPASAARDLVIAKR